MQHLIAEKSILIIIDQDFLDSLPENIFNLHDNFFVLPFEFFYERFAISLSSCLLIGPFLLIIVFVPFRVFF